MDRKTKIQHVHTDEFASYIPSPSIVQTSTIFFKNYEEFLNPPKNHPIYGRHSTPIKQTLERLIAEIENGISSVLYPSGLKAITTAMLAVVQAGDHLLVADNIYAPAHEFFNDCISCFNVEVTFYDPLLDPKELEKQIKPNTKAIYFEPCGSMTFEMQSVQKLAEVSKRNKILLIVDNSWSSGYNSQSLNLGADVSILSCTKYINGHSDILMGSVSVAKDRADIEKKIQATSKYLGNCISPHDVYEVIRGMRTLPLRLKQHNESALQVIDFLDKHEAVFRVLSPVLTSDKGHSIWKAEHQAAGGLFGCDFNFTEKQEAIFFNSLKLFKIGYSWGGFESLILPVSDKLIRNFPTNIRGRLTRIFIGLEDIKDILADIKQALEKIREV